MEKTTKNDTNNIASFPLISLSLILTSAIPFFNPIIVPSSLIEMKSFPLLTENKYFSLPPSTNERIDTFELFIKR